MCKAFDDAEKRGEIRGEKRGEIRGEKRGEFRFVVKVVGDYIAKKKMTQKAACEELSIDYRKYLAAKRYMKQLEVQN